MLKFKKDFLKKGQLRDSSTLGIWYLRGILEPTPHGYRRMTIKKIKQN